MKNFSMTVPGSALTVANAIRKEALDGVKSWRPIAFSVSRGTTLLHAAGMVEIPLSVGMDLSSYVFKPKSSELDKHDYVIDTIEFSSELWAKDIEASSGSNFLVFSDSPRPLIAPLNQQFVLSIFYRNSRGVHSPSDNTEYLRKCGVDVSQYLAIASRHTNAKTFTFEVEKLTDNKEILNISISSDIGNEDQILRDAVTICKNTMDTIYNSVVG